MRMSRFRNATKDMGTCDCCRAPAVSVSTAFAIPGMLNEETHRWCEEGRRDSAEFSTRPGNILPEDLDVGDEGALDLAHRHLLEIQRRREDFIRERVKRRRR